MATIRTKAMEGLLTRKPVEFTRSSSVISDYYGELVFDRPKMRKFLTKEAYRTVCDAIDNGTTIDRKLAEQVAMGMKTWAIGKGATHYTHWFHPLTDGTAEKHDAFIDPVGDGTVIESFSGKLLSQQEPDASSFPSGGIRNTFEARGYTAWDVSSPAFIVGTTLCVPTIFISYTGEALDYKTPLLKALNVVDKAAVDVCQYFDKNVTKVWANLGWEQEYFLVDEALYLARPDLSLTGRTLMGHSSAKDQQLEDHYFASIPERVSQFMMELEYESHRLGIPVKTRHNEVAPNQFELAPVYEECNLANDHNQMVMDVMRRVARHHGFRVLLHEKPYAGINGSGKHCNWSLATNTGVCLHSPGKNPKSNMQFLTFIVNTIKAVFDNQDLLRASIMTATNMHRLGANEAPPAIISVFLGDYVSKMLDHLEEAVGEGKMTPDEKTAIKLDIGRIPEILLDNTDRNRTSPFAFTGNRFEFRAVGSSANCASAMIALNTAVAYQLKGFKKEVDALIDGGDKKDEAIFKVLKKTIKECKAIRFDGNGYGDEWKEEAKRRGLTNITSVPEALKAYTTEKTVHIFESLGVLSNIELQARAEVELEKFTKKLQIEARVFGDLAMNHIIPTCVDYQTILINNVRGLKEIFASDEFEKLAAGRKDMIREIAQRVAFIKTKVDEMVEARKVANVIEDNRERAEAYDKDVRPYLDEIRYHIDKLELVVDNKLWPLPKYRELLFAR